MLATNFKRLHCFRVSSQERTKTDSRGSTGSSTGTGRDERISALDTARRLTSNERKSAATSGMFFFKHVLSCSPRKPLEFCFEILVKRNRENLCGDHE